MGLGPNKAKYSIYLWKCPIWDWTYLIEEDGTGLAELCPHLNYEQSTFLLGGRSENVNID